MKLTTRPFTILGFIFVVSVTIFTPLTNAKLSNNPTKTSEANGLAQDKEWLRLLNYKRNFWGGYTSEADGRNFFLHPDGKTRPLEELKENIRQIFFQRTVPKGGMDNHARCRFPARAYYLSRKLGYTTLSENECVEFQKFKTSFNAESISLVFSAYYINNPSSTFGHTFLRVNKKRNNMVQNTELLDLGVNFAANPWTDNPIIYTFGGIIGSFPGIFSTMPYYYKVREYNDFESRDLWSYKLNFTQEEIDQFIRHLWELGQTHYDYFFFTENCSYHIFTALEAAAPRFDLSGPLPYWAIPSDTILIAHQTNGLVEDVHFRPSARNIFLERYNSLNKIEKEMFLSLKDRGFNLNDLADIESNSQLKLIDTALDWMEYKHSKELQDKDSSESHIKNQLLIHRTKHPPQSKELVVEIPRSKPHNAHSSMRYGVETGYADNFEFLQRYHVRFALHDWLDPDFGYPENMQIEFFNIQLQSYDDFRKLDLHEWTLVSVKSLAPFEDFEKKPSWDLSFGLKSYSDDQCNYCQAAFLTNSWGIAYDVFPKMTFYALASGDLSASQKFTNEPFRVMVGPKVGILYKPKIDFKFHLQGTWLWDPFQEYDSYGGEFSLRKAINKEYALGATTKITNDIVESSIQFFYYH